METIWSLSGVARRYSVAAAAAVALAAAIGLVAVGAAQTGKASKPGHVLLDEDLLKLGIVVMANQTPITQADAQAVLPVLEKIQAQLEQDRAAGTPPDDAALVALDAELLAALTPKLQSAVGVVRLLIPPAPLGPDVQRRRPRGPGPAGEMPPGPPRGGPNRGPRGRGRGPGGTLGPGMLGALVDFFRSAAGG